MIVQESQTSKFGRIATERLTERHTLFVRTSTIMHFSCTHQQSALLTSLRSNRLVQQLRRLLLCSILCVTCMLSTNNRATRFLLLVFPYFSFCAVRSIISCLLVISSAFERTYIYRIVSYPTVG